MRGKTGVEGGFWLGLEGSGMRCGVECFGVAKWEEEVRVMELALIHSNDGSAKATVVHEGCAVLIFL